MGHARLQLRPQRGEELPDVQRALLAGRMPLRWPARGCGRFDAVSGLFAQGRRMAPQQIWRTRNPRGGDFLREMNIMVHEEFPGALTMAEESTAWPGVSRPVY